MKRAVSDRKLALCVKNTGYEVAATEPMTQCRELERHMYGVASWTRRARTARSRALF